MIPFMKWPFQVSNEFDFSSSVDPEKERLSVKLGWVGFVEQEVVILNLDYRND